MTQYLVQEIFNHSRDDSQPEVQGSNEYGLCTNSKQPSERRKQLDCTYRLPKSAKIQTDVLRDTAKAANAALKGCSQIGDNSVLCQPSHDMTIDQSTDSLLPEAQPLQKFAGDLLEISVEQAPQEGVQIQPAAYSCIMDNEPEHPLEVTHSNNSAMGDAACRQPVIALNESTKDIQNFRRSPSPSEAEQRETAVPVINGAASDTQTPPGSPLSHGTETLENASSRPAPSTPKCQIGIGFQSPLSDDQTVTPCTVLFTPTVCRETLSPLTEDNRTASPLTLSKKIISSPTTTGQQATRLSNAASTHINRESLIVQDGQTMLSFSPNGEAPTYIVLYTLIAMPPDVLLARPEPPVY